MENVRAITFGEQIVSALLKLSNTSWSSDYGSIPSPFSVKQSSTNTDHTISTMEENGISSHGVGEGIPIM